MEQNNKPNSQFMRKIFWALGLAVFGGVIGFGVSHTQAPEWKVEAQIDSPKIVNLGNYYTLFSTYQFIQGGDQAAYKIINNDKGTLTLLPENTARAEEVAIKEAYTEFKRNLISSDVLKQFLNQQELVSITAKAKNQTIPKTIEDIANAFQFESATVSKPHDRISIRLNNAEDAHKLLREFIQFTNQQTKAVLNAELIAKWKVLFQQVKGAAESNLGAIQQGSQIAVQDWKGKLGLMRSVQPLDNQLIAFRFVQTPSIPLVPISPAKWLWGLWGALAGLLIGLILSISQVKTAKKD